jgi:two-component sensor histidine kinase
VDNQKPSLWQKLTEARIGTPWLLSLFVAAVLGLAGLMIWQNYRSALAAGEARAVSSAHVVAAHVEWMIEASAQALQRIDTSLGPDPFHETERSIPDITKTVSGLPQGFEYAVYDAGGQLKLASKLATGLTDISREDYFKALKSGAKIIIAPQTPRGTDTRSIFVIACRVDRAGFRGVAIIEIPNAKMDEFWGSIGLGPHSTVSVIRTDGTLIARHPDLPGAMNLSGTPLFTTYLPKSPSGFYHNSISMADGLSRIVGYWKVEGWPLVATAGVDSNEALELFWKNLKSELAFGLPAIALLLLGAFWITHLLDRYEARNRDLEQAVERNQYLMREIHHRVKNNFQAVASLVRLQSLPKEAQKSIELRIAAMIAVHEQFYGGDQYEQVDVAPYAKRLVEDVSRAYPNDVQIEMDLQPLNVHPDRALPIGMIINEVVSNAFKYAFANRGNGNLRIELSRQDDNTALLTIRDDGPGSGESDVKKGMGSRLIAGFASQLGATVSSKNEDGTVFTMTFPV